MWILEDRRLEVALGAALLVGCNGRNGDCFEDVGLAAVHEQIGTDFLALRTEDYGYDYYDDDGSDWRDGPVQGTACSGADDPETCRAALDAALPSGGWRSDYSMSAALVATRGDEVVLADSLMDVVALFGGIDTPEKAFFLVEEPGEYESTRCRTIKVVDEGIELRATVQDGACSRDRPIRDLLVTEFDGVEVLEKVGTERSTGMCAGRRPDGLAASRCPGDAPLPAHLAHLARLEAAAVVAFERLAVDLTRLGAPETLVARARQAALDEVDHAARTAALAAEHGVAPAPVVVGPHAVRSVLDIALENATEGCVRETWGVVDAGYRALHAPSPAVRALYARISDDEARHAELSWDVHRWLRTRLTAAERTAVDAAMAAARAELEAQVADGVAPEVERALGAPPGPVAVAMVRELDRRLAA